MRLCRVCGDGWERHYFRRRTLSKLHMFCKPFRGSIHWTAEGGTGIASEATSKMTDYVFAETEIVRIAALVYSPNTASMKVLEKCGYRLEAIRQKSWV